MRLLAITFLLALAACGTPTVAVRTQCLPMVVYSQEDQATLAKEWKALDPKSVTASRFIPDAIKMRDADRACQSVSSPPQP